MIKMMRIVVKRMIRGRLYAGSTWDSLAGGTTGMLAAGYMGSKCCRTELSFVGWGKFCIASPER